MYQSLYVKNISFLKHDNIPSNSFIETYSTVLFCGGSIYFAIEIFLAFGIIGSSVIVIFNLENSFVLSVLIEHNFIFSYFVNGISYVDLSLVLILHPYEFYENNYIEFCNNVP